MQNHSFAAGFKYINYITSLETIKTILPSNYTHWEKKTLTSQDQNINIFIPKMENICLTWAMQHSSYQGLTKAL